MTSKLALQWLPCQAPGVIESVLGPVGPVSDNLTCCHTEIEVADPTFYLTQSQYTDTGPTSPSADSIMPGAVQGSHWSANFEVTGMTRPRKNPDYPSPFAFHLGFVHPLQVVALHQILPLSSVYCFPVPGGPLLVFFFFAWPSSTLSSP